MDTLKFIYTDECRMSLEDKRLVESNIIRQFSESSIVVPENHGVKIICPPNPEGVIVWNFVSLIS